MASKSACSRAIKSAMPESSSSRLNSLAKSSATRQRQSMSLLPFPPARRLISTTSIAPVASQGEAAAGTPKRRQIDDSTKLSGSDSATSKAERTLRRFWKKVDVAYYPKSTKPPYPHLQIRLDGRSLKTPSGTLLAIPEDRSLMASLIAREWAEQDKVLKTHSLPMTSLAARAIDGLSEKDTREQVCDELIKYLETETICFHETEPPVLVELQRKHWDPTLQWTSEYFNLPPVRVFSDILGVKQDEKVTRALRNHISTYDAWDLAALERIVRSSKSFLIGIRFLESIKSGKEAEFGVTEAAEAAEVEVRSQTNIWGEVEDTHDVDQADLRKTMGSVACTVTKDDAEMAKKVASEIIER
ncbi:hypothetical protein CBS101457_001143 [Exobasidium rhododendri]|nr:hypothetical protein CBS101457_001143 [Exobasidium rhododendri]